MNMVLLIHCSYCGSPQEPGRHFCKAANVQCYKCGKLGHLWRMCHSQLKENALNRSTQHVNPKQGWNAEFSSGFDYKQSPNSPSNMRDI